MCLGKETQRHKQMDLFSSWRPLPSLPFPLLITNTVRYRHIVAQIITHTLMYMVVENVPEFLVRELFL